jgi:hypothetical protein
LSAYWPEYAVVRHAPGQACQANERTSPLDGLQVSNDGNGHRGFARHGNIISPPKNRRYPSVKPPIKWHACVFRRQGGFFLIKITIRLIVLQLQADSLKPTPTGSFASVPVQGAIAGQADQHFEQPATVGLGVQRDHRSGFMAKFFILRFNITLCI